MKKYEVIIAGASFAGLSVASKLTRDRVLLIDRKEIGTGQTSACGTTVKIVKDAGCEKSILKVFDTCVLHTKNKEIDIPLPEPFCTIDYEKFCELLAKQSTAEFLKANVKGVGGSTVFTSEGDFQAEIIVDCTGWPASLATSLNKDYLNRKMLSFGIETEIPYEDNKLRFFVNPDIIENGVGWLFPCEKTARFGVGSYAGNTKILSNLKNFVESYDLKVGKPSTKDLVLGEIHGGYFCYCLKSPIVKNIFVVGCAAGQTLPLTGEGIRRSVYFGLACGAIIQEILANKISLKQGQKRYKELTLKHQKDYNYLLKAQNRLATLPDWQLNLAAKLLTLKPMAKLAWKRYKAI